MWFRKSEPITAATMESVGNQKTPFQFIKTPKIKLLPVRNNNLQHIQYSPEILIPSTRRPLCRVGEENPPKNSRPLLQEV